MKKIILILISTLIMVSCKEEITKPSDEVFNSPYILSGSSADGYLFSTIFKGYSLDGATYTEYSQLDYYFYDSLRNPVVPNLIKLNSSVINNYKNTTLPYIGSNYSWEVTGNSNISTFNYLVNGIVNTNLISPKPDTTIINKSNGITINYTAFSGVSNVLVFIKDNAYLSKKNLDSTLVMNNEIFNNHYPSPNTGSFTITPSMLSHLTGKRYIEVSIIGYNTVDTTFSSREYQIVNGAGIEMTYEVN